MNGFFDIIFECNSRYTCTECKYRDTCYNEFQRCFNNAIPCELWRSVTCFDNLIKYVNEWREYQNEQTVKQ
jgi:hypothetical protein